LSRELADFEKQVYDFIKEREEMLISSIPARMRGAIPTLKKAGLIKIFKKRTIPWASKKRKFVKAVEF
jgi:hypothetical protein